MFEKRATARIRKVGSSEIFLAEANSAWEMYLSLQSTDRLARGKAQLREVKRKRTETHNVSLQIDHNLCDSQAETISERSERRV